MTSRVEVATSTVALPDLVGSCVEVAVMVAVPAAVGLKTPALLTAPTLDGLTDQVTELLKLPVPVTVGVHADVCEVRMAAGAQTTETEVIVGGADTVTAAEPDLVKSCVEVAVMVAVPAAVGVKTPALLTAPTLDGLTDQVTELLKLPVPVTVGVHADVCVVRIEAGEQFAATEVIVGVLPLPMLPPAQPATAIKIPAANNRAANLVPRRRCTRL